VASKAASHQSYFQVMLRRRRWLQRPAPNGQFLRLILLLLRPKKISRWVRLGEDNVWVGECQIKSPATMLTNSSIMFQNVAELERKQVDLQVLDQNINTKSATGRLLFNMLGAIAQFETEIRAERQREGFRKPESEGLSLASGRN
jgi:DNA invertase Pin-like site-specific DNA recombinase